MNNEKEVGNAAAGMNNTPDAQTGANVQEEATKKVVGTLTDKLTNGLSVENKNNAEPSATPTGDDTKLKDGSGGSGIAAQFTNLPIGALICEPFLEIARGQAALCDVYISAIKKLAYKDGKGENDDTNNTQTLDLTYEKPVVDSVTGDITSIKETVKAPLLSLVPVPSFLMTSASVDFDMEVNVANTDTSSKTEDVTASTSLSFWTSKTNIQGKLTNSSTRTGSSSSKATYHITVNAAQQEPAEGMAKLTALLASVMEPIKKG